MLKPKSIIALAALMVSGIAYVVATRADEKASEVERMVDITVKDLSGMSSLVISGLRLRVESNAWFSQHLTRLVPI